MNGEGEDGCLIGKNYNTLCEAIIASNYSSIIDTGVCCTNTNKKVCAIYRTSSF